jgi:hypothetical protein
MEPIVVEGDLSILTGERRLVLGYFGPGQRDLADVIQHLSRATEAFGVTHVGPVRITIEPVGAAPESAAPAPRMV